MAVQGEERRLRQREASTSTTLGITLTTWLTLSHTEQKSGHKVHLDRGFESSLQRVATKGQFRGSITTTQRLLSDRLISVRIMEGFISDQLGRNQSEFFISQC